MKIVVAPDSFKECLTAKQVAGHIAAGIRKVIPEAGISCIPVADGGEGTVEALVEATGGSILKVESVDALLRPLSTFIGISGDKSTAFIEMASASGLGMIKPSERNPLNASSLGTGILLKHALDLGFTNIILGIGGSATNDGGMGMATALGYKFLDKHKNPANHGGGKLKNIKWIDTVNVHPLLAKANIQVACDVNNPLCGINGASAVFGPQKGANPSMVKELDDNLLYFAQLIKEQLGKDVKDIPGAGAAGGLGAGLLAFSAAMLQPGFEIVKNLTRLEIFIEEADFVFTAEGKIDFQTQYGKTPFGVAQIAKKHDKPVIALAGNIGEGAEILLERGITAYFSITNKPLTIEESMLKAGELLEETTQQVMRLILQRF